MKNLSILFAGLVLLFLLSDCGKESSLRHSSADISQRQPITVSIDEYTNLTTTSVDIRGTVSARRGDLTARGVCWATHANPSISDNKTSDGTEIGRFISLITGLSPSTHYYIRPYAQSTRETVYGNEIEVTTAIALPVLETKVMTSVFTYDAIAAGAVKEGGPGFCWSTSPNPTVNDSVIEARLPKYQSSGEFERVISGLRPNTTYYLKAFATNRAGTAYGNQITFTTNSEAVPAQDYLPLQVGNYWELGNGNGVSSMLIDKTEKLDGVDYYRVIRKGNPLPYTPTDTFYLRKTLSGIVYTRDKKNAYGEIVMFYLAGSTGEVWYTAKTMLYPQSYANLSNKSDTVKRNSTVLTDCFRFEYYYISKGSGESEDDYWLAPNLGFVKYWPIARYYYPPRRLIKSRINGIEQTY